MTDIHTDYLK